MRIMTSSLLHYSRNDFQWETKSDHNFSNNSKFDDILQRRWKDASSKDILRYQVDSVQTKILPGKYRIVVQLNPMRAEQRRTPVSVMNVKQPFDRQSFNFTRVKEEEILLEMTVRQDNNVNGQEEVWSDNPRNCYNKSSQNDTVVSVIVNVSPICFCHNLLVPSRLSCQPQVLNEEGLTAGLESVLLSGTPSLKVGFNSLGGMASVNHNHWHIYYLPHSLPVETARCQRLIGPVFTFEDHFAPGFVFHLENQDVKTTVRNVMLLVNLLLEEELGHNVVITRGLSCTDDRISSDSYNNVRICVWARKPCFGVKQIHDFAAALVEFAGHLPVYNAAVWESITEERVTGVLNEACSETFRYILPKVNDLFSRVQNCSEN